MYGPARSLVPLVAADLRQRYAGSVLGGLWAVLAPLLEVAAYAAVFGLVLRPRTGHDGLSYALFVASGILPWSAVREAVEGSASLLPSNRWIRRSRVPIGLLVARHTLVSASRAAVGLAIVALIALATGRGAGGTGLLLAGGALLLQTASAYGLGLAAAPLGTLYPDLRPALGSAFTVLVFASPIVYPESLLGPAVRALVEWNPFTHLLRLYRAAVEPAPPVRAGDVAILLATPLLCLLAGGRVGERLRWAARDRL